MLKPISKETIEAATLAFSGLGAIFEKMTRNVQGIFDHSLLVDDDVKQLLQQSDRDTMTESELARLDYLRGMAIWGLPADQRGEWRGLIQGEYGSWWLD